MTNPRDGAIARYRGRASASIDALRLIAHQLGPLAGQVVFIGGAIAPLLQSDALLPSVRPTKDVDGVIGTASYTEWGTVRSALIERGFEEDTAVPSDGRALHLHRWRSPSGGVLDLVPAGDHAGGTGSAYDAFAVSSALTLDLRRADADPPCIIRHASAVAFLVLKWDAFHDRGRRAPFDSHDLEDIVALVASRPSIVNECRAAPPFVREHIGRHTRTLLADPEQAQELLAANLPVDSAQVLRIRTRTFERFEQLAALATSG